MQKRSTEWPKNSCGENATPFRETGRGPSNATPVEETLESVQNATPVEKTLRKRHRQFLPGPLIGIFFGGPPHNLRYIFFAFEVSLAFVCLVYFEMARE